MHFIGVKSSPLILLLLKHKDCLARMEVWYLIVSIPDLCNLTYFPNKYNALSQSNNLIKVTHYDETKKRGHDSQMVRAEKTLRHITFFPFFKL